jgi:hypothetical protein
MDFQNLYKFAEALERDALIVRLESERGAAENWKLVNGELRPDDAIVFRYHIGATAMDLVGTTYSSRVLLSDRIIAALNAANLRGFLAYPCHIFGKDGNEIAGYRGFSVTGRCGPPDDSQLDNSKELQGNQFAKVKGLYFDPKTWDGSDIFLVQNTRHICVTQAVYDTVQALNPSNIRFTALTEVSRTVTKPRG